MGFQQDYDNIVQAIELNVRKPAKEIREDLSQQFGISVRSLSEIFSFITGYPMSEYIRYRKAENIIQYVLQTGKSLEFAVTEEFNYGEYTAFFNWFKDRIKKKPKDIIEEREKAEWVPALYLRKVLSGGASQDRPTGKREVMDIDDYKMFELVDERRAFYGLSAENAVEAYNLSKKYDVDIDSVCQCFEASGAGESAKKQSTDLCHINFTHAVQMSKRFNLSIPELYWDLEKGFEEEGIILKQQLLEERFFTKEELYWLSAFEVNDVRNVLQEAEKRGWDKHHAIDFYKRISLPIVRFTELYLINGPVGEYRLDELQFMENSLTYQDLRVEDVTREYLDVAIPLGGDLTFDLYNMITEAFHRKYPLETIPKDGYEMVLVDLETGADSIDEALDACFFYLDPSAMESVFCENDHFGDVVEQYFDQKEYKELTKKQKDDDFSTGPYEYYYDDDYNGNS